MPKQVDVPGLGPVEFPDSMPDAIIEQVRQQYAAKSPPPPPPPPASPSPPPTLESESAGVASQMRRGVLAIPGLIGDAVQGAWDGGASLAGRDDLKFQMKPSDALMELTGGQANLPQTTPGKYAGSILEGVVGGILPTKQIAGAISSGLATAPDAISAAKSVGSALRAPATIGAGVGAGIQAGGDIEGDNALWAQLAGGAVGGLGAAAALPKGLSLAEAILQRSMRGVNEGDFARGRELRNTFDEQGIPYTASGLLPGRLSLGNVVSLASMHPEAKGTFQNHMHGVDRGSQDAINRWSMRELSAGVNTGREGLDNLQGVADKHLKGVRAEATQKFRDELSPGVDLENYDQSHMRDLYEELGRRKLAPDAGPTSRVAAGLNDMQKKLVDAAETKKAFAKAKEFVEQARATGDTDLADEAAKFLKDGLDSNGEPLQRFITQKGHVRNLLSEANAKNPMTGYKALPDTATKEIMRDFLPDYENASAAMRQHMDEVYKPTSQGLVGDLARMGGGLKQDRITANNQAYTTVFNPEQSQAPQIKKLFSQIGDKGALEDLAHSYIQKIANSTFKSDKDAALSAQPFKFTQALMGSQAQRDNMGAVIEGVAKANGKDPAVVLNGFKKLIHALDATKNMELSQNLDLGAMQQEFGTSALSMLIAPASRAGRAVTEGKRSETVQEIARIVTSKNGSELLERIAKAPNWKESMRLATDAFGRSMTTGVNAQGSAE